MSVSTFEGYLVADVGDNAQIRCRDCVLGPNERVIQDDFTAREGFVAVCESCGKPLKVREGGGQ